MFNIYRFIGRPALSGFSHMLLHKFNSLQRCVDSSFVGSCTPHLVAHMVKKAIAHPTCLFAFSCRWYTTGELIHRKVVPFPQYKLRNSKEYVYGDTNVFPSLIKHYFLNLNPRNKKPEYAAEILRKEKSRWNKHYKEGAKKC